jgi:hypothetical protein
VLFPKIYGTATIMGDYAHVDKETTKIILKELTTRIVSVVANE